MDSVRLREVLGRLERYTKPGTNDRDFPRFVNYINGFLKHFGQERAYITGSTTENLKIKWSKDGGDADFLLLSGKFTVPVADIELRKDFPCYCWVRMDKEKLGLDTALFDGIYLPGDILRNVSPELFTCLRGIYLILVGNSSNTPKNTPRTILSVTSKVGIAVNTYSDLKIDGQESKIDSSRALEQLRLKHEQFGGYMNRRRENSDFYIQDVESIERAIQFISTTKIPGSSGSFYGHYQHFAFVSGKVMNRLGDFKYSKATKDSRKCEGFVNEEEEICDSVIFQNDLEMSDDELESHHANKIVDASRKIRSTYEDKYHLDFVPAIKLHGPLPCMEEWKKQEHRWLIKEEVEVISKLDVFIVARYAPVNPSRKDFCLSFTLAENKLSQCMSPLRRQVFLALKACLKGFITLFHKSRDREVKLTTYHLKTLLYRVSDVTDPIMWIENNIYLCVVKVLEYLEKTLLERSLMHYFTPSNLYANFDSDDFDILLECIRDVLREPISAVEAFFTLEDGVPNELWLTLEEAEEIQALIDDTGLEGEIDRMEEAILDILRGLNEGPRDSTGKSPLLEAMKSSVQLFLQDEAMENFRELGHGLRLPAGVDQLLPHVLPVLTEALGGAGANAGNVPLIRSLENVLDTSSTEEEKKKTFEKLKYQITSYFSR